MHFKWSIRELGSLSVLAGTGAGTGRPRELYLYMTLNRLYEICLINSYVGVEEELEDYDPHWLSSSSLISNGPPSDRSRTHARKYINPPLSLSSFLAFPSIYVRRVRPPRVGQPHTARLRPVLPHH